MNVPLTRLLFFEDSEVDKVRIRTLLRSVSDERIDLTHVATLAEGLRWLEHNEVDAILLDLGLPDSEGGISTLQAVVNANDHIPVIVLTGLEDTTIAIRSVEEGAQDYLVKEDVDADRLIRSIRYSMKRLENERSRQALADANHQFETARQIQQMLFPSTAPPIHGYDIFGRCIPTDRTGGDFFDFIECDDKLVFAVGDASGHGLPAAMMVTMLRSVLRTLLSTDHDLSEIIPRLQELVAPDFPETKFATLLVVSLHPPTGRIEFAGAGQPAMLVDADGTQCSMLEPQYSVIMAGIDQADGSPDNLVLEPGQTLVMYTDGICEIFGPFGKMFGESGICDVVRKSHDLSARETVIRIMQVSREFGESPPNDDRTAVVLRRLHDTST